MGVTLIWKRGKGHLIIRAGAGVPPRWQATGLTRSTDKALDREVLRMAEVLRTRAEAQLVSGEYGLTDTVGGKRSLVDYATEAAKDPGKVHLRKSLSYLRTWFGPRVLSAVEARDLEAYRDWLCGRPTLAQVTASHYFQALKTLLRRAERDRLIPRSPGEWVDGIPIPEPVKEWLTAEELGRLSEHLPGGALGGEIARGFLFACMVGLRKSDIASLTWGDIQRGDSPQILKRQKKTRVVVGIPINASAWALIKDDTIHARDELVFPLLSASKTDSHEYFRLWERVAHLDKHIGWHTARHTFAVLSLQGGADLYTVSKLLGHTSIKTTEVYAKATDGMKRAAVDGLPEVTMGKQERWYKRRG